MKLIFAGTPEIAATVLQGLLQSEHEVVAVLTQPDRPSGRGQKLTPSPVKALALEHHLPVLQPLKLSQDLLKNFEADLMIVVAYGLIIPEAVLTIPRQGCWNVHVSLLPRWRGAAPIQRAIEAGDRETGVTLMQMDKGLDTGPILLQEKVMITEEMTGGMLHDLLAEKGRDLLLQGLQNIHHLKPEPQASTGVSYAKKLCKEEAHIDWSKEGIACKIRAFNPWPICYTTYNDEVIRIWKARVIRERREGLLGQILYIHKEALGVHIQEGVLEVLELQRAGGKPLAISVFLNGHPDFFAPGALLK